ncbi:hypothetical protein ACTTAI_00235 (plasmid) [Rhodobacter capsulatus]
MSADNFGCSQEEVNWGHVGTLSHDGTRFREFTDMARREGEQAV